MYGEPVPGQLDQHRRAARRWVAHVDMDAFFASVEQRDDPALHGLPVVVANSPLPLDTLRDMAEQAAKLPHPPEYIRGMRGVVASASYEARAFGVRSAMPLARALVLCPHAVVLPGRFERYRQVAEQLRGVWAEFSPLVEPVSLDEAYLDLTNSQQAGGGPIRMIGERLKARIREDTALTASVGIAPNKLVAKIASDLQKPDGLVIVEHGTEATVLAPLPVRALPGVGPRTAEALRLLGITTLGELATADERNLAAVFGEDHAASLRRRARGEDHAPVQPPGDPRSISREVTLAEDLSDPERLKAILRSLAGRVARTLQNQGFCARCVYIKLRLLPAHRRTWRPERSDYGRLMSRQHTLPVPTDSDQTIYEVAAHMLDQVAQSAGLYEGRELVRLIGVGVTSLVSITYLLPPLALRQPALQDGTGTPTST
jgi:DNA polymerase-4